MKTIKIFLSIIGALLVILAVVQIIRFQQRESIDFQIRQLEQGDTKRKVEAIEFIAENKRGDKIPDIMKYIDSYDFFLYLGKDAYTLTCAVTLSLEKLTSLPNGNTCDSSNSKTPEEEEKIRQSWKDWYANEYQKWEKTQPKN